MGKVIDQIIEEEFYCLTATDGSIQVSSLAPDLPMCMAMVKLMHSAGIGESLHKLKIDGFTFEKVILTITVPERIN